MTGTQVQSSMFTTKGQCSAAKATANMQEFTWKSSPKLHKLTEYGHIPYVTGGYQRTLEDRVLGGPYSQKRPQLLNNS